MIKSIWILMNTWDHMSTVEQIKDHQKKAKMYMTEIS